MLPTPSEIADALTTALNAHTFSQAFTAARDYAPDFKLEDMGTLHVTVVPASMTSKSLDRARDTEMTAIDVCVQQKGDPVTKAWLDGLLSLVKEIHTFCRLLTPSGVEATCVERKIEPIYDHERLRQMGLFTSVLTLTFRADG